MIFVPTGANRPNRASALFRQHLLKRIGQTNAFKVYWPFLLVVKVRNIRPGGLLVVAPPCNTWVVVYLGLVDVCPCSLMQHQNPWRNKIALRSRSQTGRSWSNPGGNQRPCVQWGQHLCSSTTLHVPFLHYTNLIEAMHATTIDIRDMSALLSQPKTTLCPSARSWSSRSLQLPGSIVML